MIIYSKYYNDTENIKLIEKHLSNYKWAIDKLEKDGYIINDGINIILTDKSIALFCLNNKDEWFEKLWSTYPASVGLRRIRLDKENCKNIFKLKIRSEDDYNRAIEGLKNEIRERTVGNGLKYMVEFSKWLRNKRWEEYLNKPQQQMTMTDDI